MKVMAEKIVRKRLEDDEVPQGNVVVERRSYPEPTEYYIAVPELDSFQFKPQMPTKGKYYPELCQFVYRLRLLGLTRQQICAAIGIQDVVYQSWIDKYPEFQNAHQRGGQLADANVAHSLYWRAVGYSYRAEKLFYDKDQGVVRADYIEHEPPNVHAQNMWLTNRAREHWRNHRTQEHTGEDGTPLKAPVLIVNAIQVNNNSDE